MEEPAGSQASDVRVVFSLRIIPDPAPGPRSYDRAHPSDLLSRRFPSHWHRRAGCRQPGGWPFGG
eukprot:714991-Hanusia_phi.AAC.1